MDSEQVTNYSLVKVRERLLESIRRVRQNPLFRRQLLVVAAEAAPGPIADTFAYLLVQEKKRPGNDLGNILMLRENGTDRKVGVIKTKKSTAEMVRYSGQMLTAGLVRYSKYFTGGLNTAPQAMKDKFHNQMTGFKYEIKYNKNDPHAEPKGKWTGKKDDLLISFMTALIWMRKFELNSWIGYDRAKEIAGLKRLPR